MVKAAIMESVRVNDALIDQQELATSLGIDIGIVEKAYEELVSEGIVHAETYHVWKDPESRQKLYDAMKEEIILVSIGGLREMLELAEVIT